MTANAAGGAVVSPVAYLTRLAADLPDVWSLVDRLRGSRGSRGSPGLEWPAWCFLPMAGSLAILDPAATRQLRPLELAAPGSEVAAVAALVAWRTTQGIYEIDPDLWRAVLDTPLDGALPAEALTRLPEWCVYLRAQGGALPTIGSGPAPAGVFVFLESDANSGVAEFRAVLDRGGHLEALPSVHLAAGGTLADGLAWLRDLAPRRDGVPTEDLVSFAQAPLTTVLQLALVLCAENLDLASDRGRNERPERPAPVVTRRGRRFFPPARPTIWTVGARIGAALRAAADSLSSAASAGGEGEGSRASPRPHIRRAHWHHFWRGAAGGGARELVLRWLPPIGVRVAPDQPLVPTVRRVAAPATSWSRRPSRGPAR